MTLLKRLLHESTVHYVKTHKDGTMLHFYLNKYDSMGDIITSMLSDIEEGYNNVTISIEGEEILQATEEGYFIHGTDYANRLLSQAMA